MLLVSPNPRIGSQKIAPKDVVIVFDHSGSMSGEKIAQAKQSVRFILANLNDADRFNVIAYNDLIEPFFDGLAAAEKAKLEEALDRLDRIEPGGGTNIHEALQTAMKSFASKGAPAAKPPGGNARPKYVIFLTDGIPTVGKITEKEILAETKSANTAAARLFAFGVGYDVNIRLLDKLVRDNRGKSDYLKPKENIETKISSLYAKIKNPVMTNLAVRIEGLRLRDTYPRQMGDLFEGDQILLVGRYHRQDVAKLSSNPGHSSTLVITGTYEGKQRGFEYPVTIRPAGRDTRFVFVERLWALRRVGYLLDQIQLNGESKELIDELVQLSKRYGIMTPYTSFLADEETELASPAEVRRRAGIAAKSLSVVTGAEGQIAASNRREVNRALRLRTPGPYGAAVQYGWSGRDSYEADKKETITNVRQVGNQALYRRGRLWVAANASHIQPRRDAAKIRMIDRFSEEYFRLVHTNTTEENQIFASQAPNEELLIELRGQVYQIR